MLLGGVALYGKKHVRYALQVLPGIAKAKATEMCNRALIHQFCSVDELKPAQIESLRVQYQLHEERERVRKAAIAKKHAFLQSVRPRVSSSAKK